MSCACQIYLYIKQKIFAKNQHGMIYHVVHSTSRCYDRDAIVHYRFLHCIIMYLQHLIYLQKLLQAYIIINYSAWNNNFYSKWGINNKNRTVGGDKVANSVSLVTSELMKSAGRMMEGGGEGGWGREWWGDVSEGVREWVREWGREQWAVCMSQGWGSAGVNERVWVTERASEWVSERVSENKEVSDGRVMDEWLS